MGAIARKYLTWKAFYGQNKHNQFQFTWPILMIMIFLNIAVLTDSHGG